MPRPLTIAYAVGKLLGIWLLGSLLSAVGIYTLLKAFPSHRQLIVRVLALTSWVLYAAALAFLVLALRGFKDAYRVVVYEKHLAPEQLVVVKRLWQVIADYTAHTPPWKPLRRTSMLWRRVRGRELPEKPALVEVELVLKECENAVGLMDKNMEWALFRLRWAAKQQKDAGLQCVVGEKTMRRLECVYGKESEAMVAVHRQLGMLYFSAKQYPECVSSLEVAMRLYDYHVEMGTAEEKLPSNEHMMGVKQVLAAAYAKEDDFGAAESILKEVVERLEKTKGVMNTELLGTQHMMAYLVDVYVKQGLKSAGSSSSDGGSQRNTLRCLGAALALASNMPSLYAFNLKSMGRLFVKTGRTADAEMAFKLANTVFEDGDRIGIPQNGCSCLSGKHTEHGLRKCDGCSAEIRLEDRWYFCRRCPEVDSCRQCYEDHKPAKERVGVEDIEKFPRKCVEHEYYEVREDQKDNSITVERWIAEVSQRLKTEMMGSLV